MFMRGSVLTDCFVRMMTSICKSMLVHGWHIFEVVISTVSLTGLFQGRSNLISLHNK